MFKEAEVSGPYPLSFLKPKWPPPRSSDRRGDFFGEAAVTCDRGYFNGELIEVSRSAIRRYRRNVVLGAARFKTDQHAQGGWVPDAFHRTR
jgi:hypothetical protein